MSDCELSGDDHDDSMEDETSLVLEAEDDGPTHLKKSSYFGSYIKNCLLEEARKFEEEQDKFEGEKPVEDLKVFSACIGVLSQEYVDSLPMSISLILKKWGRKNRVTCKRVGDNFFFLGKGHLLLQAYQGLPQLVKRYRDNLASCKTPAARRRAAAASGTKLPRLPLTTILPSAPDVVLPDVETPDGRRASSRLHRKPRKSYATLNNGEPYRSSSKTPSTAANPSTEKPEKKDTLWNVFCGKSSMKSPPKSTVKAKSPQKVVPVYKDTATHEDYFVMEVDENEEDDEWMSEDGDEDESEAAAGNTEPYLDPTTGEWVTPPPRSPGNKPKQNETSSKRGETEAAAMSLVKPSYVKLEKVETNVKPSPSVSDGQGQRRKRGRPRKFDTEEPSETERRVKVGPSSFTKTGQGKIKDGLTGRFVTDEAEESTGQQGKKNTRKQRYRCDVCFRDFIYPNVERKHRATHFQADGKLETSAIVMHLQALEASGREENLTGELLAQINEYRQISVEIKTEPDAASEDEQSPVTGVVVGDAGDGENLGRTLRGRKPNFQKGIPVKVDGESISATGNNKRKRGGAFPCDQCCAKLLTEKGLARHKKEVHSKVRKLTDNQTTPLQCPHCDFVCTRTQNFSRHIKSHSNADIYRCNMCSYSHKERSEVMRHQRNAHGRKQHQCPECPSKHRNKQLLQLHIKTKHRQVFSAVCDVCGQRLLNRSSYKAHMQRHEDEAAGGDGVKTQVMCNMCARVLPSQSSFQKHLEKFHSDNKNSVEMQKVNEGVNILDNGQFQCKYCTSYINQSSREVRRHIMRKHMEKTYKCDQCKSAFPLDALLQKHIKVVHYGLEKKKCTECSKWFRNNTYLMAHMKRAHSDEFQCPVCQKVFRDRRNLLAHSEIHKLPEERTYRFSCEICEKKFRFSNAYEQHMMTHTGQRPFACTVCGASFTTKTTLETHMAKHSDERPFGCDFCDKKFKLKKYLDVHLLIHSGNNFTCSLCQKLFGSAEALEKHTCKAVLLGEAAIVPGFQPVQDVSLAQLEKVGDQVTPAEQQVLVQLSTENKQVSQNPLYMCSTCDAGFQDVESAAQHVCPGKTETSSVAVSGQEQAPTEAVVDQHTYSVLPSTSTEPQLDLASTGEYALDTVQTSDDLTLNGATTLSISGQLSTVTSAIPEISLADSAATQYADLANISDIPQVTTGEEATPMEMYMCGMCNSLFVSPEDVQEHMQVHSQELTAMLESDGTAQVVTTMAEVHQADGVQ